ncbi:MAG: adenine-specific DNA-methyltransferase [Halanaerobiales bacterium]|nr:adenine-specific DNA-methyltransferase [Halanaerobiales bacterium]
MDNRVRLQNLLKELFQFDNADLDFGIYRIMNQKHQEIKEFINKDLINFIEEEIVLIEDEGKESLEQELERVKENAESLGVDYKQTAKYQEIQEKMAQYQVGENLESEIYNDIYTFFKRYYDNGDFLSKRRYSKQYKYAIPYNGEEVYLHWANNDQYYIKTSEEFNHYTFKQNNFQVNFEIKQAQVEKNNNKADEDRYFLLKEKDFFVYDPEAKILTIYFEYRNLTAEEKKNYKTQNTQADIREYIEKEIADIIKADTKLLQELYWLIDEDNKAKSILAKHLYKYTKKNKSDYFIHKDLKGFLERELDFYIKNEIMDIDSIGTATENDFKAYLTRIKVVKAICQKIIEFLAQIENYQKKLFEKKKFVLQDEYCLTLDRVPEKIRDKVFNEVLNNHEQLKEWEELYGEKIASKEDLFIEKPDLFDGKGLKNLVIDTKYFDEKFKDELLAAFDNLDEEIEGLLINSENFQALNLLLEKYRGKVKCIYIDPPYNTGGDDFIYKDNYQHSSWLTMMENRLALAAELLADDGVIFVSIDDNEHSNFKKLCDQIFGDNNFVSNIIWQKKFSPQNDARWFSDNHDFIVCYAKNKENWVINLLPRTEKQNSRYKNPDNDPRGPWTSGDLSVKTYNPDTDYEITTPSGRKVKPPAGTCWRVTEEKFEELVEDNRIWFGEDGNNVPRLKRFLSEVKDGVTPLTIWTHNEVGHNQEAKQELKSLLNEDDNIFDTPKTVRLIKRILQLGSIQNDIVMDFFAGSGTTGQAALELNKEDEGNRKYIQVELGDYFYTTMLPRLKRIMYSSAWKDGQPQSQEGYSHIFKYQSLEQYEDTLDNIKFEQERAQLSLNDQFPDYLIKYMLDYETSKSLLDIDKFTDPFNYCLEITMDKEKIKKKVNLVETFNYLIGLDVQQIRIFTDQGRRYKVVTGKKNNQKILIVWRNIEGLDLKKDKEFVETEIIGDKVYDLIYLNGDNYLPGSLLIEEQFSKLLFA